MWLKSNIVSNGSERLTAVVISGLPLISFYAPVQVLLKPEILKRFEMYVFRKNITKFMDQVSIFVKATLFISSPHSSADQVNHNFASFRVGSPRVNQLRTVFVGFVSVESFLLGFIRTCE